MKVDDIDFINQLVKSLEDSEEKLEEAYKQGDSEAFNNTKKLMLKIQSQLKEVLK